MGFHSDFNLHVSDGKLCASDFFHEHFGHLYTFFKKCLFQVLCPFLIFFFTVEVLINLNISPYHMYDLHTFFFLLFLQCYYFRSDLFYI